MTWYPPIDRILVPTQDSESFKSMGELETGLPLAPHPGSFGFERANHTHEGVDLYCIDLTPVHAVEDGEVVSIQRFTGSAIGSPWWEDTFCVMVEGESGVVLYGEVYNPQELLVGQTVFAGEYLSQVKRVLKKDKGRPMSMLHLELHQHGSRSIPIWEGEKPPYLLDPTPYLLELANRKPVIAHDLPRESQQTPPRHT